MVDCQEYEYPVDEEAVRVECAAGRPGLLRGRGHRRGGPTVHGPPPQILRQVSQ